MGQIEVLCCLGCVNAVRTIKDLHRLIAETGRNIDLVVTVVNTAAEAETLKFPGTPTVRVNGEDIELSSPTAIPRYSLDCRLYWYDDQFWMRPSEQMLKEAIEQCLSTNSREVHSESNNVKSGDET